MKKYYFDAFQHKKNLEKQPQLHSQTNNMTYKENIYHYHFIPQ